MRRNDRAQDRDFALSLIDRCTHGVMALTTGEAAPYCLPLSFVRVGDELYFHCAREGRKIDLLRQTDWVSFEMDTGHAIVEGEKAHSCTAIYHCVMGGGRVRLLEDPAEKVEGLCALMVHDTGTPKWTFDPALVDRTAVIRLDVEELTCKVRA